MEENLFLLIFAATPMLFFSLLYLFFKTLGQHKKKTFRWLRLCVGNVLVFLMLSSIFLFCGEIYYRFLYDATDFLSFTKVSLRWFDRYYRLNGSGFRDDMEYISQIALGRRRITFLGDSFTAGHGVPDVEKRFANLIRKNLKDWEVHVFGRNGLSTGDALELLEQSERLGYQFDQLVLVYNLGDIEDLIPNWIETCNKLRGSNRGGFLLEKSYFLNTIYYHSAVRLDPEISRFDEQLHQAYQGSTWEWQKTRLSKIKDLVHRNGGRLLVVTFPWFQALGPGYGFGSIHDQLGSFWSGLEVPHLDLLSLFQGLHPRDLWVNAHDAHPNEKAHKMTADILMAFLFKHLSFVRTGRENGK